MAAPEPLASEEQQRHLIALDAILDVSPRDHTTPTVVPEDVRTVLMRIAKPVCAGNAERANELIETALDDDEPASTSWLKLRPTWDAEDARLVFDGRRYGGLTYGGALRVDDQPNGTYVLTASESYAAGSATITVRLSAEEMDALGDAYLARRDRQRA